MNRAQAIKLRRVRRGGVLFILGVLLLSLWACDPGRLALVSSATDMIRLAPGPDGPVVFSTNDFGHELYGRDVALIRADAVIGDPVISIGGVPIVIEDRLDLPIAVDSKAVWP